MKQIVFTTILLLTCSMCTSACTIFNITLGEITLIGNNEDWRHTDLYIRFYPAQEDKYGRIFFGFGKNCKYTFGGINDQGLFYDIASLTERNDIKFDSDKETIDNPVYEKMLETCSSIEEAITLISQYNVSGFERHHIMIVDKSGNSAILEWGSDSLSVIKKKNNYQVMTNFNNTNPALAGWYPCVRFEKVEREFANIEHFSIEKIRGILESVQNSSANFPTVYSNIYDLKNNTIHIYYFHNFEEYYIVNIKEELEKKGHSYYLPSLFSNLKLLSPLNNVSISEPSVDLVWQGNANRYKLFLSTDPDFKNCEPIEIVNDQITSANNRNASFILFGLVPALVITCKRRKRLILLSIMVPFCFNFTSCDNKNSMDETLKYTHSVPNLEKNKTYYWKIETIRDDYILSSSITKKFKTDN